MCKWIIRYYQVDSNLVPFGKEQTIEYVGRLCDWIDSNNNVVRMIAARVRGDE
jgi:hypothetical protein